LISRELVVRQPRRPGQKEERYEQVLGGGEEGGAGAAAAPDEQELAVEASAPTATSSEDRLDRIERELESLRAELAKLREALGEGD
jgi:uncharacterized protein YceH (UPF0502 family)